jgi:diaminohydroxyphosphoribosylaminopyrimidine deaminase/5-amino-6-(5-phosphoribosylamino)uracil reductase
MFPEIEFMRLAHRLAVKGVGKTSPNPAVGAVVVKNGRVVGSGWHRAAGMPHAEVEAIASAGKQSRGADLYVTLEPCSHQGKTGPCVRAILDAGIRRVAASMEDPNPLVSGRGFAGLGAAGVEVHAGMMETEALALNRGWIHWIRTGRPFVTLKLASSLDGQIAGATGASRWITGEASRRRVHRMRAECDAVLVGGRTAVTDDPLLTCRIRGGRNPIRVVLSAHPGDLRGLRMLADPSAKNLLIVPEGIPPSEVEWLEPSEAETVALAAENGTIDPEDILRALAARGVTSLLVEGGGKAAGAFLRKGAVDRLVMFFAPVMLGEAVRSVSGWGAATPADGRRFSIARLRKMGEDFMVEAFPVESHPSRGNR